MDFSTPTADELPLIIDSWSRSYKKSPYAGCVRNCDWNTVSKGTIGELLDRSRIIVAVTPIADRESEYPKVRRVMAYSVSEPGKSCLHWLYVKDDYRGMGVGRALLAKTIEGWSATQPRVYTHRTNASAQFLKGWRHRDVLARVKQ